MAEKFVPVIAVLQSLGVMSDHALNQNYSFVQRCVISPEKKQVFWAENLRKYTFFKAKYFNASM